METMMTTNGNGGAGSPGATNKTTRDFESEIREHGFSIGTKPGGTFFLENLSVTRQLIRKPTN